ncbi:MAG: hypothetical protein IPJ14_00800 [Kineosporiaceae bacterium]|nr:hypothetical protein [Kineosporiaceae bacterium]
MSGSAAASSRIRRYATASAWAISRSIRFFNPTVPSCSATGRIIFSTQSRARPAARRAVWRATSRARVVEIDPSSNAR